MKRDHLVAGEEPTVGSGGRAARPERTTVGSRARLNGQGEKDLGDDGSVDREPGPVVWQSQPYPARGWWAEGEEPGVRHRQSEGGRGSRQERCQACGIGDQRGAVGMGKRGARRAA